MMQKPQGRGLAKQHRQRDRTTQANPMRSSKRSGSDNRIADQTNSPPTHAPQRRPRPETAPRSGKVHHHQAQQRPRRPPEYRAVQGATKLQTRDFAKPPGRPPPNPGVYGP